MESEFQSINSGIAKDRTTTNNIPAVLVWPYIFNIQLKRVYINPSSNASDIGKAMDNQEFVRKSTFDQ